MFSVNYWGSKPGTNDDCITGTDYPTLSEAEAAFNAPVDTRWAKSTAWVELDGPEVHKERQNPAYRPTKDTDDDWRREMRMEAAMLHGIQGWNDFEGM
jgi:hypothetical protein